MLKVKKIIQIVLQKMRSNSILYTDVPVHSFSTGDLKYVTGYILSVNALVAKLLNRTKIAFENRVFIV